MKTDVHFWSYLAQFFLEWKMFGTNVVENIYIYIYTFCVQVLCVRNSCRIWDK